MPDTTDSQTTTSSDLQVHEDVLDAEFSKLSDDGIVLAVVTATKPDFYKQAPIVRAAEERDLPCFVLHTGQHYDDLLGHGLREYGIEDSVGVDLGVRGGLSQKTSEIVLKIEKLADHLEENYSTRVLPIVHGDTLAAGIVPQAWMMSTNQMCAHNEAGLRGMAPSIDFSDLNEKDPEDFVTHQWVSDWEVVRNEPFPEQYDTFVGSAASIYHFAPTQLNRRHLVREGYPEECRGEERIPVVGNSVVDAIDMKKRGVDESVFDVYPVLEERDDWIRVDIHRRANLLPRRFKSIIGSVIDLVERGYNVNLVELTATRRALENYGLGSRIERLDDEYDNFLFTGLWKKHAHVYEFLESGQCFAELTDSGSMQEELNHIDEALCMTARFNTDRPETVFDANTNVLVPPASDDFMTRVVEHVYGNREEMRSGPNLYGQNVGERIVDFLSDKRTLFEWSHERLGFEGGEGPRFEYL